MADQDPLQKIRDREHFYENVESLAKHLDKYFKSEEMTVFHEVLSLDFHLDVYLINRKEDNFKMLLTSGMSLLPMTVPDEVENKNEYQFAELMLLLPKDIEFPEVHTSEEGSGWLITMLKETARFPHHYDTWLSIGHTLQATHEITPYNDDDDDDDFVGCLILPSATFGEDFTTFYSGDRKINIYSIFPLYKDELEYKIEHGFSRFFDFLIEGNVPEIFNVNRVGLIK